MKKILLISLVIIGVVASSLGTVAAVSAKGPVPQPFNGQGGTVGQGVSGVTQEGFVENEAVHDLLMAAFAEKLNLPIEQLTARIDAGETFTQIALSAGFSLTDARALFLEVQTEVKALAITTGLIVPLETNLNLHTQDQNLLGGSYRRAGSRSH
ncbi:MAG: hypothetical protein NTZ74_03105 [Chloroflexi bacterium]|nr:hypothetical protein [Chloroflexota bacterium]